MKYIAKYTYICLGLKMEFFYGRNQNMGIGSTFHIVFLIFNFLLTAALVFFFRKSKPLTFRIVVAVCWLIVITLEVGKQINWGINPLSQKVFTGFDLRVFPFAICSLPYYLWPIVAFFPEGKCRTAISIIAAIYLFFPAVGFQFVPGTLGQRVFINHQTMIHHGLQMGVGLLIFVHEFDKFNIKSFIAGSIVMMVLGATAILLNIVITNANATINLWELNPVPGHGTNTPFYRWFYNAVPYPIYLLIYCILFNAAGTAVYLFMSFIYLLIAKYSNKVKLKSA